MEKQEVSKKGYEAWVKRMCHEFYESMPKVFRDESYIYIYKGSTAIIKKA